jgi:hypothetical protein
VLLSYRLLFGQNRRSRQAFRRWVTRWQNDWKSTPNASKPPADPILLILGSQSWESDEARQIYDEIGANDPASHYSPTVDFVFFGRRLLDLQNYVRSHSSQSILGLWSDRRSEQGWWTFWVGDNLFQALATNSYRKALGCHYYWWCYSSSCTSPGRTKIPFVVLETNLFGPQVCSSGISSCTGSTAVESGQSRISRFKVYRKRIEGCAEKRFVT